MNKASASCGTISDGLIYMKLESLKEEGGENVFEGIMPTNFPNLMKTINSPI